VLGIEVFTEGNIMSWEDIIKAKKPDFLDLDGDGNKKEPMSEAAKDVKKQTDDEKYLASLSPQEKKKVLEARKLVSQGIPSNAPTTPRIPQWKKMLKGASDKREELREEGKLPFDVTNPEEARERDKGYEDRQLKDMLSKIEEWAENFPFWEKTDEDDPIKFRKSGNKMFYYNGFKASTKYSMEPWYPSGVYYMINNYFEDLKGTRVRMLDNLPPNVFSSSADSELLIGSLDGGEPIDGSSDKTTPLKNFKLNPELKNNPMKYKNEITQLYRDLTLERMIR